jgi:glycerophosphoryl diester phosphodiesterase
MRLLIKNGADGIITDRPDLLIEVINELEAEA